MYRVSASGKTSIPSVKYEKAIRRLKEKRLAFAMWCVVSCMGGLEIHKVDRDNARKAVACNKGIFNLVINF